MSGGTYVSFYSRWDKFQVALMSHFIKVGQMYYFIIGGTNVLFYYRWDKCQVALMSHFIIGGTNVLFYYRWHKCHGGTYVTFYIRWYKSHLLAIGGTNVSFLVIGGTNVDLIEGGTNVGGTNVGWTNVGGRKVAASFFNTYLFIFGRTLHRVLSVKLGVPNILASPSLEYFCSLFSVPPNI
jgi:hypothetical protein